MIDEDVVVECAKDEYSVNAKFWLTSDTTYKNISIGFPAKIREYPFPLPSIPIWNFKCTVNNEEVYPESGEMIVCVLIFYYGINGK